MAIPTKRYQRNIVCYLNLQEIKALLHAPNRSRWLGRRDHTLLMTAIQTGLRVSELITLRVGDVSLRTGAHVTVIAKGSKQRAATRAIGQLPWGHNTSLLTKLDGPGRTSLLRVRIHRLGWSRPVLEAQIATNLRGRRGKAVSSFAHTLPR